MPKTKEELQEEELKEKELEEEEKNSDEEEEDPEEEEDRGDIFEEDEEDSEEDDEEKIEEEDTEEEEEDEEEDAEKDLEEDDEEEIEEEKKEAKVPISRLNEVIDQRQYERSNNEVLRKQNEELLILLRENQDKEKKPDPFDFDAAEEKYMEAILEAETEKAQTIRARIRKEERLLFMEEAKNFQKDAVSSAKKESGRLDDETKFNIAVKKSEETFEFLNNKSTKYNKEAVNEVNDLYDTFLNAGLGKAASIQKAVDLVSPKYDIKKEKTKLGKEKEALRKKAALKKNASAQNRQPVKMKGRSARDKQIDEYDVSRMTDSQFGKLTKREKAELRGDLA